MHRSKAIVFGLGRNYLRFKQGIEDCYQIVAVTDNDSFKLKEFRNSVFPSEIQEVDYDVIVITPKNYAEIYNQLLSIGVERHRIITCFEDADICKRKVLGYSLWGQHCEDLILASIFSMIGIDNPTYMDIGVNSPYDGSNTAFLYLNGCRGINIDANPSVINSISQARPEDLTLNIGVAGKEGSLKFYYFGDNSAINTFSEKEAMENGVPTKIVELPVTTLTNVVSKYCNGVFPDFLDIDIEGLDYEVLDEYDLKNNGPAVICTEVRRKDIHRFDVLLEAKNYFRFCRIGENNIYVRQCFRDSLSHY